MAIIYSYPLNKDIKIFDELVGTTKESINGQLKTVTRNFLLQDLAEFFIVDGGLQKEITLTTNFTSGAATFNQVTGVLNIPQYSSGSVITPSPLTRVNDTNITLTLGGTPNTSLLQGVSLTLGWTGTLSDSRIASASIWNAKENSANKQNSLAVDGTGTKFPTVDAVNAGITNSNYWTKTGNNIQNNTTGGVVKVQGGTGAYYDDALQTVQSNGTLGFRAQNGGNFYYQYGYGSYSSANTFGNASGGVQMSTTSGNAFISNVRVKYLTDLSSSYDDRTLVDKGYVTTALIAKENSLPTVPVNGYVLSSTTTGVRSWIPMTGGGGGVAVNFYLNGSVASGVAGYQQIGSTAVIGAGTDFTLVGNGTIAQFLTDAGSPNRLEIPSGAWNFELWLQSSNNNSNTNVFVELYKYDGTFTLIASNSPNPIVLQRNTTTNLYLTSLAIPQTALLATDRFAIRVIAINSTGGHSVTLHTEDSNICEILTNFVGGIVSINGITQSAQILVAGTTGSDFIVSSSGNTHTFNLPDAGTAARGVVTVNNQQFSGLKNFTDNIIVNGININKGSNNAVANIAIGLNTLDNTIGNQNTAIGYQAATKDSILGPYPTSFNTVVGYQAYGDGEGNNNTAIGWRSLFSSEANNNSALGYSSGLLLTTGFQNTFIGAFAGGLTGQKVDANNSIAIGYNAITTKNNQVVLGNDQIIETLLQGNIKLGTTPSTSIGTYQILTLNTGTGVNAGNIEKVSLSNINSWTLTVDDIRNNNIGNTQVKILAGKQFQLLNSGNTIVGYIDESGIGRFGPASTYTAFGPASANIHLSMVRSQMSANFTLGNPQISQPYSLSSTNNFGTSYLAGSNEAAVEVAAVTATAPSTNWNLAVGATNLLTGGYTHTSGSVVALTTNVAAVANSTYKLTYTITLRTAGSINISFGGISINDITVGSGLGVATYDVIFTNNANTLTITPTSDFNGNIVISLKRDTALAEHSFNVGNSNGNGITSGVVRISKSRLQSEVPVKYAADISASYDDRTLVDKQYVDSIVKPYKVYTALLSQSGITAPVATVLENTLGFNPPLWLYNFPGDYSLYVPTLNIPNKIGLFIGQTGGNDSTFHFYQQGDDLWLDTRNRLTNRADDLITFPVTIEIRVYN
jgi:hypothetical protein